jgi:aldose 1-epimerase
MKRILSVIAGIAMIAGVAFCQSNGKADLMIKKELFGRLSDGRQANLFTLKNASGMTLKLTDYGATVVSVSVPDRNGKFSDVTLGYDSVSGYANGNVFFGGVVGRYANRIAGGKFKLDGKEYQATVNDGRNCLHGGKVGFHKVLWTGEQFETPKGPAVKFSYLSKDGEEGFPGNVTVTVTYTLQDDNSIRIDYTGVTDKTTVLNLCNHSYFNLTGDPTKTILDHELMINADDFTPVDSFLIPTGKIASVGGTPFDFRKMTSVGARIDQDDPQLKICRGYDMNWVLNGYSKRVRKVAELFDPSSGREMDVFTDQPGLQFYSGNFLNGSEIGKSGVKYQYRTGLALETQHYPDSPNEPKFPPVTLKPGQKYHTTTIYKFSVKK